MKVRRGLLVQTAQLMAQLYLDWCVARGVFDEPFTFLVPRETLDNLPEPYRGVFITVSPAKMGESVYNLTPLGIVNGIAGTIGDKRWKPRFTSVLERLGRKRA